MPHEPIDAGGRDGELAVERDLAAEADLPTDPKRMARRDRLGRRQPPWWFGLLLVGGMLAIALLLGIILWEA